MNPRVLPAKGRAAAENALLSQLGLPPSASPEDIDALHEAASEYLAAAPSSLRGWAHAQAAALDAAYLNLTDPVGLEGSALRSPTRPPTVVPGGPATPPARRDSVPATTAAPAAVIDPNQPDVTDDEPGTDFDSLYAAVTPSAHADMGPDARPRRRAAKAVVAEPTTPNEVPSASAIPTTNVLTSQASGGLWRRIALGGVAVVAVIALAVGANVLVNGGAADATGGDAVQASAGAPAIDQDKVSSLMAQYQANPQDTTVLLALANEFYAGQEYESAATWLDKVLAIEPDNIQALLARGAVSFNLGDLPAAETTWKQVVDLAPDNAEVHYDLGFLYLNQTTPDWAGVEREWTLVTQLDPGSQLAQTVQSHLDALATASMLPASPAPGASASPDGSAAPDGSAPASPAASPGASAAASAAAPAESVAP